MPRRYSISIPITSGESVNTFATNCLNDPDQIQDSDGAAVISNPSQNSNAEN